MFIISVSIDSGTLPKERQNVALQEINVAPLNHPNLRKASIDLQIYPIQVRGSRGSQENNRFGNFCRGTSKCIAERLSCLRFPYNISMTFKDLPAFTAIFHF